MIAGVVGDGIVGAAVDLLADEPVFVSAKRREAALAQALRAAFDWLPQVVSTGQEARYRDLPGWTHPPGGVDVFADLADGEGRLLCELKVDKPEEALWDALKLADIGAANGDGISGAYLV